jgi:hypothetical protein
VQFIPLTVGGPNQIFPDTASVVRDFVFAQPMQAARAMLRGFALTFDDDDEHLRNINVTLTTHFHPGDRAGVVEVGFILSDDNARVIRAQVDIVVIGLT